MNTQFQDNFYPMLNALGFGKGIIPSASDIERRIEELKLEKEMSADEINQWKTFFNTHKNDFNETTALWKKQHNSEDSGGRNAELTLRMQGSTDALNLEPAADLNQKLQEKLNNLHLSSSPQPRFFVAGSPQSEVCVMADRELLMRVQFGSLFIGGGAAIELFMEKLSTFLKPVDVSIIGMEVLEPFIRKKNGVKLTALCSAENKSDYYDHLKAQAKKTNIEFEVEKDIKKVLNLETKEPEKKEAETAFSPSPFSLKPTPFK